jgi:uncharacterized protein (DUF2141 family)
MLNFAAVRKTRFGVSGAMALGAAALATSVLSAGASAQAASNAIISNDLSKCAANSGPSILVDVAGFEGTTGNIRVQLYPATRAGWLTKGAWLARIDTPVRASGGKMRFCLPAPGAGRYGVAVRHDLNGNGKTDISKDGGGFSNNPKLSIFNLGKPAAEKAAVTVGNGPVNISIRLQYL